MSTQPFSASQDANVRPRGAALNRGGVAAFVAGLIDEHIVANVDWLALGVDVRNRINDSESPGVAIERLSESGLLTGYQAERLTRGDRTGLVIGNYRLLEPIGFGGMGEVFKAEHRLMRRIVAIKVISAVPDVTKSLMIQRFFVEMQVGGQALHPNLVAAWDAGETRSASGSAYYLVMEYVPGDNLDDLVTRDGPMAPEVACRIAHQIASALDELHRLNLLHRDIKPSNVRRTPDGQVKLLDFGLARHWKQRITQAGIAVGTPDFMAPEQAIDAATVDIRADIYSLGCTLFWCLAGQVPFTWTGHPVIAVAERTDLPIPSLDRAMPGLPEGLPAIVARMMDPDPAKRYQTPGAVLRALFPYIHRPGELAIQPQMPATRPAIGRGADRRSRVLVVDDDPMVRQYCRFAMRLRGHDCHEATNGEQAVTALDREPFDLVLLDVDMPGMSGTEVVRHIRANPSQSRTKILMMSGNCPPDRLAAMLAVGVDDYMAKPLAVHELQARVEAALRLRDAHVRSDLLTQQLMSANGELERTVAARDSDLVEARNALILALAKLVEQRDTETGTHLLRIQRFCRCLCESALSLPSRAALLSPGVIDMIENCSPLHDIGKVGLPDFILQKPGKLTPEERETMQSHTVIGADTLTEVARQHCFALQFLHMAADIARHHHERWDGNGYPYGLAGEDIPLAARVVAIADVYDALRSRRPYKPALPHIVAVQMIVEGSPGHFDPVLLEAFRRNAGKFEQLFRQHVY